MATTTLQAILEQLKLEEFAAKLADMGCVEPCDVLVLTDVDLGSLGLNLVKIRSLQRAASAAYEVVGDEDDDSKAGSDVDKFPEKVLLHPPSPLSPLKRTQSAAQRKSSKFWQGQMNRPKRLIFIRHGESEANVKRDITMTVPDHLLHLTEKGREQALDAGNRLKEIIGDETLKFIVSPYVRTRETFNGIKQAWGSEAENLEWRSDVRIREQEFGNYDHPDMAELHKEKKAFGAFYFRFPNGESPADCYDRASIFYETMYRRWEDNTKQNQVIVGHGMMIALLLVRLFRWSIEEWHTIDSLENCEFVVLERPVDDSYYHVSYTWAAGREKDYRGLRKTSKAQPEVTEIWDGKREAKMLKSQSVKVT